jgi:hypothetical protein
MEAGTSSASCRNTGLPACTMFAASPSAMCPSCHARVRLPRRELPLPRGDAGGGRGGGGCAPAKE